VVETRTKKPAETPPVEGVEHPATEGHDAAQHDQSAEKRVEPPPATPVESPS